MKNSEPIPDSARDSPSPFNNDKLLNEIPPHESTEMVGKLNFVLR